MLTKPFKLPLIKKAIEPDQETPEKDFPSPPSKRRRLSPAEERQEERIEDEKRDASFTQASLAQPSALLTRKPLTIVRNPPSPEGLKDGFDASEAYEHYYMVLWRRFTLKKNKTWDGDGILSVKGGYASLQDVSGAPMGRIPFTGSVQVGSSLSIGGKDIEVDSEISRADLKAGRPFLNSKTQESKTTLAKPFKAVSIHSNISANPRPEVAAEGAAKEAPTSLENMRKPNKVLSRPTGLTKASLNAFKTPLKETTVLLQGSSEIPVPRHDPQAPDALVFKRPKRPPAGKQLVDVVLDPLIGKHLLEHQREGVRFLYECVMNLRDFNGEGCILADEMGLGKTLQTIALLWTLLKQNPIYRADPVVKKALIVCPVTLIGNWRKEFRKWLGDHRIGVYVADGTKTRLTDFTLGSTYQVMIIGYERLRTVAEDLTKGNGIDIVVADEGHRLKTERNKSAKAIQSLNTAKRIILSGTPIQNDLGEFFVMANFINEGCLGTYKSFVKNFETPILKSRQPNALEKDIELGEARSEELAQTTSSFILRRTIDILSRYLPPKTEYVLFCNPTPEQANIYRHVITSPMFQCALGNAEKALELINILKKLSNSPSLLLPKTDSETDPANSSSLNTLLSMLPQGLSRHFRNQVSTKVRMLDQLLHQIRKSTDEKVVIVSNYTSTMDIIANLLSSTALPFLRLDGSTPTGRRMHLVDEFNKSKPVHCFIFLLSAKAGGQGLNLIGASRLILFDVDWNPAIEEQAMARIHRQGQRRECKIYRFIIKGGIEEKIWMRQIVKRGLADAFLGGAGVAGEPGNKSVAAFSREELRHLFRFEQSSTLRIHELIGCECGGKGVLNPATSPSEKGIEELSGDLGERESEADEVPDMTSLMRASDLSVALKERQESQIAAGIHPRQNGAKLNTQKGVKALMEYVHLDASLIESSKPNREEDRTIESLDDYSRSQIDELLGDECLMTVLREQKEIGGGGGISWVFKKSGGGQKLDEGSDRKSTEVKAAEA